VGQFQSPRGRIAENPVIGDRFAMSQRNEELEDAALQMMVSRRCRRAYVHDIRGGLQAINSALELLSRSMVSAGDKQALMQKALEFARRAVAGHEKCMDRLMEQLIPYDEVPGRVNLGSWIRELLQFLQNDAASKEIRFDFSAEEDVTVSVHEAKLRLVMLGLITGALDNLPPGKVLRVGLHKSEGHAVIAVPAAFGAPDTIDLVQSAARRVAARQGGRTFIDGASSPGATMNIFLPLDGSDAALGPAAPS
jgi:signal transduction histidine kinase